MEPIIIRAYQLKARDIFKKVGMVYIVISKDETGVYYMAATNQNIKSKEYTQHFGSASHEMIELIERSDFND